MIEHESKVTATLARRNWALTTSDGDSVNWRKLVDDVRCVLLERHRSGISAEDALDRAVIYAYCPILLAACREEGSPRQERAFTELWHWIYPRVYARVDNALDAEDVAQKVLMRVYQSLHRVEQPHGFLGYVSVILRREVGDYYLRIGRRDEFEQEISGRNGDNGDDDGMDDLEGPDSFLKAELDAAEEELIRMICACMPKEKWRRTFALLALTLLAQTAAEVAEVLKVSANAVYMLHFQAKKDLPQHCPDVIEFIIQRLAPSKRLRLKEGNS
jgi:RNA polymerase sigma factor (sigma-70 family)